MYPDSYKELSLKWKKEGKTQKEISQLLGVPFTTVQSWIKPTYIKRHVKKGRPEKLTKRVVKAINQTVKVLKKDGKRISSKIVQKKLRTPLSIRSVQRALKRCSYRYRRIKQSITLKDTEKERRVNFVKEWIQEGIPWCKVIFSDEKRFTLDGPDNYWNWIKEDEVESRSKRPMSGGGIMLHGYMDNFGCLSLRRLYTSVNKETYLDILSDIIPSLKETHNDFIWMQDNAPAHSSKLCLGYLKDNNIKLLKWPPRSPDMNLIENIWAHLSYKVYENKQYSNYDDLSSAIEKAAQELMDQEKTIISALYDSFSTRCIKLIKKDGDIID